MFAIIQMISQALAEFDEQILVEADEKLQELLITDEERDALNELIESAFTSINS